MNGPHTKVTPHSVYYANHPLFRALKEIMMQEIIYVCSEFMLFDLCARCVSNCAHCTLEKLCMSCLNLSWFPRTMKCCLKKHISRCETLYTACIYNFESSLCTKRPSLDMFCLSNDNEVWQWFRERACALGEVTYDLVSAPKDLRISFMNNHGHLMLLVQLSTNNVGTFIYRFFIRSKRDASFTAAEITYIARARSVKRVFNDITTFFFMPAGDYCETLCCSETALNDDSLCGTCKFGPLVVVLDLDETLICGLWSLNDDGDNFNMLAICGVFQELTIFKRPWLDHFLQVVFSKYHVYVWTAASKEYAKYVLECILKPDQQIKRLLTRNETILRRQRGFYSDSSTIVKIKPLKKIQSDLSRVVMIDDTASVFKHNSTNGILIKPFCDPVRQIDDSQLLIVLERLKLLENVRDVRPIIDIMATNSY